MKHSRIFGQIWQINLKMSFFFGGRTSHERTYDFNANGPYKIPKSGIVVSRFTGTSAEGYRDGNPNHTQLNYPEDISFDFYSGRETLVVADCKNCNELIVILFMIDSYLIIFFFIFILVKNFKHFFCILLPNFFSQNCFISI
jgi:hypothetical protein